MTLQVTISTSFLSFSISLEPEIAFLTPAHPSFNSTLCGLRVSGIRGRVGMIRSTLYICVGVHVRQSFGNILNGCNNLDLLEHII